MSTQLLRVRSPRGLVVTTVMTMAATLVVAVLPVTPAAAEDKAVDRNISLQLQDAATIDELLIAHDLQVVEALVPSRGLWVVTANAEFEKSDGAKKLAKELDKDPSVIWAEVESSDDEPEDDRFHAWPNGDPSSPTADADRWLDQDGLRYLRLDAVHRRTTGHGVTVAILDTGVDREHPELSDHLMVGGHYDYVDDDDDPMEQTDGVDDDGDGVVDEAYGHGTHAAGLVALVAPDAEILSFRVLNADGTGNPYVVGLAVHDAIDAGADVINISFGIEGKPKSKFLKEAFKRAKKEDVVVVAAVGNHGDDEKRYPANEKNVIGVAALGHNRIVAQFSNHGKAALVAAPGQDVVSTLPGGGFGAWSGTSMAAPIVTGQAALLREISPDVESKKVIEIVGKSAIKIKHGRKIEKGLIDILRSLDE